MAIMVGTGRGARAGVLVKNAEALELLEKVDTLVVDKTGTLTEGKPPLTTVHPAPGYAESQLLQMAASLERGSEHALASAILSGAAQRGIQLSEIDNFASVTGRGVLGTVDGHIVAVGNARMLEQLNVDAVSLREEAEKMELEGQTVAYVVIDHLPAGLLGVVDPDQSHPPKKRSGNCIKSGCVL